MFHRYRYGFENLIFERGLILNKDSSSFKSISLEIMERPYQSFDDKKIIFTIPMSIGNLTNLVSLFI